MQTTDNGNQLAAPVGFFTKILYWIQHPYFADANPLHWLAFVVLAVMLGFMWSKVVKQTLDAVI